METLDSLDALAQRNSSREKLVLTLGAFDGVHIAHRALIAGVTMRAREIGARSVVVTFDPHPDSVVKPNKPLALLTDTEDKAGLIAELGADFLVIQPFTPEFSSLTAEQFVQKLLDCGDICEIHIGEDFVFGYRAQGNVTRLYQMGHERNFQVKALAPLEISEQVVSSSLIRRLITEGNVEQASRLLARPYSVKGLVVQGFQRGRLIGFPTANITVSDKFAVPSNGVYATVTTVIGENVARPSATNIGVRPTFDNGARSVESYILDYQGDLYGKILRVEFIKKLRDERKFDGIEAIKTQLAQDVLDARAALAAVGRL